MLSKCVKVWYQHYCVRKCARSCVCVCVCAFACACVCVCCRVLALLFSFVVFLFFRKMYICHNIIIHLCLLMAKSMCSAGFANKLWTLNYWLSPGTNPRILKPNYGIVFADASKMAAGLFCKLEAVRCTVLLGTQQLSKSGRLLLVLLVFTLLLLLIFVFNIVQDKNELICE